MKRSITREELYQSVSNEIDRRYWTESDGVAMLGAVVEALRKKGAPDDAIRETFTAVMTVQSGDDMKLAVSTDVLVMLDPSESDAPENNA